MRRHIVPDVVTQQDVICLTADQTVEEATVIMAEKHIGAILICGEKGLEGIFTERDAVTKVLAKKMTPSHTKLKEVMTKNPICIKPKDIVKDALALMKEKHFRHLPVLDGTEIVGIVSIRDLYDAVTSELKEDVEEREAFIFSSSYGGPK